MTTRLKMLAFPLLAGCLLSAASAQGGAPAQPTDPTAQSPVAPQTTPPTFPAPDARQAPDAEPTPTADAASATPEGVRAFSGSITRQNGAYVLKAGNNFFKLDNQSKAKEYKGKNVQVTGSLDKSTNTIHVENIAASASM
jgi:hypothetical protein